jgi:hypothetical protein
VFLANGADLVVSRSGSKGAINPFSRDRNAAASSVSSPASPARSPSNSRKRRNRLALASSARSRAGTPQRRDPMIEKRQACIRHPQHRQTQEAADLDRPMRVLDPR